MQDFKLKRAAYSASSYMVEDRHTLEYCDLTHLKPMLNTSWFKTYVWKNITPGDIFNKLCFKVRSSEAPEKIIGPLVQLQ